MHGLWSTPRAECLCGHRVKVPLHTPNYHYASVWLQQCVLFSRPYTVLNQSVHEDQPWSSSVSVAQRRWSTVQTLHNWSGDAVKGTAASLSLRSGVLVTLVILYVTNSRVKQVSRVTCSCHWASSAVAWRHHSRLCCSLTLRILRTSKLHRVKPRSKSWYCNVREGFYVRNFNTCKPNCSFEKFLYSKLLLVLYGDECIMW